jgi:hypothetical protein
MHVEAIFLKFYTARRLARGVNHVVERIQKVKLLSIVTAGPVKSLEIESKHIQIIRFLVCMSAGNMSSCLSYPFVEETMFDRAS